MERSKQVPDQWVIDIRMINHVYSWAYFPEILISGGTQRSTCFKEPRLIWFRLSSQRMPLGNTVLIYDWPLFVSRDILISTLFKPEKQECIDWSSRNVQDQIFEVKVKLDPGAERKSSGNIFWLAAVSVYFRVFFLWRLWLGMILIWY